MAERMAVSARYRDPFSVLPSYEPGHWNVTVMDGLELLATRAASQQDPELLATVLAAQAIACRGGIHWLYSGGALSDTLGDEAARELCISVVRGRDRRLLRARGRGLLAALEAFAGEGLLRDRELRVAADDYWRVRQGHPRHLPDLINV